MDREGKKSFRKLALGWLQNPDAKKILLELLAIPKATKSDGNGGHPAYTLLYYFIRTIGAASLVFGAAGLMTEISFVACAVCIYIGLFILCIDPWIEPALKKVSPWLRAIPSIFFLIPILAFTRYVVFLPAPWKVNATNYNGDFPAGHKVGGRELKPSYSVLKVSLSNETDYDYKDVDVVLGSDEYIVAAEGNVPEIKIFNTSSGPDEITISEKDKNGHLSYKKDSDKQLLSGGIRVLCDKLPRHVTFEITMAVTRVLMAGSRAVPPSSDDLLALSAEDLDKITDPYGPRVPVTEVGMAGWYYSLGHRPHRIKTFYSVKQQ